MKPTLLEKAFWNAYVISHVRGEAKLPFRALSRLREIQSRKVRAIVRHAYASVPYYREVMDGLGLAPGEFRTADDLARLPMLTGRQIALEPERFVAARRGKRRGLEIYTSGTSGYGKTIAYDPDALFLALAHGHRQRLVLARFVGRQYGYREMSFVRPGNVAFLIRDFYQAYSWIPRRVELAREYGSPGDPFDASIARVNAGRPDVLRGYGSHLGALFRYARDQDVAIHRPRAVAYGGDRMTAADRELIETGFGVPVVSTYQAGEALRIGFQCEERRAFHVNIDDVAVSVVDDAGRAVGPGERGALIVSNLTNRATVLLNYRLGDVVTLGAEPCPCGRTLPTIEAIDGRADDFILLPGGRRLYPAIVFAPLLQVPGVVQAQLTQESLSACLLRVVCDAGADWAAVSSALRESLRTSLGAELECVICRTDSIAPDASGKFRAVTSRVGAPDA